MAGKLEIAEWLTKEALEVPGVGKAAENAITAAGKFFHEVMPKSMIGTTEKIEKTLQEALPQAEGSFHGRIPPNGTILDAESGDPYSRFDSANYRNIPLRSLATDIRTGNGVTMRSTDGPSRIVFDSDNKVQHVLFGKDLSAPERADYLQSAAFAGLIHNDVLAREAASKVIGQSAGFISSPIERLASPIEMQQNAIDGARAYVERNSSDANNYTKYLTERFGPQTQETQEWGRHIVSSDGSEGIFSTHMLTPELEKSGMPVNKPAAVNPKIFPVLKDGRPHLKTHFTNVSNDEGSGAIKWPHGLGSEDLSASAGETVNTSQRKTYTGSTIPNIERDSPEAAVSLTHNPDPPKFPAPYLRPQMAALRRLVSTDIPAHESTTAYKFLSRIQEAKAPVLPNLSELPKLSAFMAA